MAQEHPLVKRIGASRGAQSTRTLDAMAKSEEKKEKKEKKEKTGDTHRPGARQIKDAGSRSAKGFFDQTRDVSESPLGS